MDNRNCFAVSIGISQYSSQCFPHLRAAQNDVSEIARALENRGVPVETIGITEPEVTRSHLLAMLNRAFARLPQGSTLIVHYSGHGISVGGQLHVVPSDCPDPDSECGDIRDYLIPLEVLQGKLSGRPPYRTLVVFDACRSGAPLFVEEARSNSPLAPIRTLEPRLGGPEVFTIFGSAPGETCGVIGDASALTRSLTQLLDAGWNPRPTPESINEIALSVAASVSAASLPHQSVMAHCSDAAIGKDEAWIPDAPKPLATISEILDACLVPNTAVPISVQSRFYSHLARDLANTIFQQNAYRRLLGAMISGLARLVSWDRVSGVTAGDMAVSATSLVYFIASATQSQDGTHSNGDEAWAAVGLSDIAEQFASFDSTALESAKDWVAIRAASAARNVPNLGAAVSLAENLLAAERFLELIRTSVSLILAPNEDELADVIECARGGLLGAQWDSMHRDDVSPARVLRLVLLAGRMAISTAMLDADYVREFLRQPNELPAPDTVPLADALWIQTQGGFDLDFRCSHPALDRALRDRIDEVWTLLNVMPWPETRVSLPMLTVTRLRAAERNGSPLYELPHRRFELSTEKTRELLMGTELYGRPELAFRELLQNAIDACMYRQQRERYLEATRDNYHNEYVPAVTITLAADERGLFIECLDNGVGMGRKEISGAFSRAGVRFQDYAEYVLERRAWDSVLGGPPWIPNSRFGIGVFSYFMVASSISFRTTRFDQSGQSGETLSVRIAATGSVFHITRADSAAEEGPGTCIRLYLNSESATNPSSCLDVLLEVVRAPSVSITYLDGESQKRWEADSIYRRGEVVASTQGSADSMLRWIDDDTSIVIDGIGGYGPPRTPVDVPKRELPYGDPRASVSRALLMNRTMLVEPLSFLPDYGMFLNFNASDGATVTVDRRAIRTWPAHRAITLARESCGQILAWSDLSWRWLWRLYRSAPWLRSDLVRAARSSDSDIPLLADGPRYNVAEVDLTLVDGEIFSASDIPSVHSERLSSSLRGRPTLVHGMPWQPVRISPIWSARLGLWSKLRALGNSDSLPMGMAARDLRTYPDRHGGWELMDDLLQSCMGDEGRPSTILSELLSHPEWCEFSLMDLLEPARAWSIYGFRPPAIVRESSLSEWSSDALLVRAMSASDRLLRQVFYHLSNTVITDLGGVELEADVFLGLVASLNADPRSVQSDLACRGISVERPRHTSWPDLNTTLDDSCLSYLSRDFDGSPPWNPNVEGGLRLIDSLLAVGVEPDWSEAIRVYSLIYDAEVASWLSRVSVLSTEDVRAAIRVLLAGEECFGLRLDVERPDESEKSLDLIEQARRAVNPPAAFAALAVRQSADRVLQLGSAIREIAGDCRSACERLFRTSALDRFVDPAVSSVIALCLDAMAEDRQPAFGSAIVTTAIQRGISDSAVAAEVATWLEEDVCARIQLDALFSHRRRTEVDVNLLSEDLCAGSGLPQQCSKFWQFRLGARLGLTLGQAHSLTVQLAPVGIPVEDFSSDEESLLPVWECVEYIAREWRAHLLDPKESVEWFSIALRDWMEATGSPSSAWSVPMESHASDQGRLE